MPRHSAASEMPSAEDSGLRPLPAPSFDELQKTYAEFSQAYSVDHWLAKRNELEALINKRNLLPANLDRELTDIRLQSDKVKQMLADRPYGTNDQIWASFTQRAETMLEQLTRQQEAVAQRNRIERQELQKQIDELALETREMQRVSPEIQRLVAAEKHEQDVKDQQKEEKLKKIFAEWEKLQPKMEEKILTALKDYVGKTKGKRIKMLLDDHFSPSHAYENERSRFDQLTGRLYPPVAQRLRKRLADLREQVQAGEDPEKVVAALIRAYENYLMPRTFGQIEWNYENWVAKNAPEVSLG